jgi:hypothetical protein
MHGNRVKDMWTGFQDILTGSQDMLTGSQDMLTSYLDMLTGPIDMVNIQDHDNGLFGYTTWLTRQCKSISRHCHRLQDVINGSQVMLTVSQDMLTGLNKYIDNDVYAWSKHLRRLSGHNTSCPYHTSSLARYDKKLRTCQHATKTY